MHVNDILFLWSTTLFASAVLGSPIPASISPESLLNRDNFRERELGSAPASIADGLYKRGGVQQYKAAPGEQNPHYMKKVPPKPAVPATDSPTEGVGSDDGGHGNAGNSGTGPGTKSVDNPDGSVNLANPKAASGARMGAMMGFGGGHPPRLRRDHVFPELEERGGPHDPTLAEPEKPSKGYQPGPAGAKFQHNPAPAPQSAPAPASNSGGDPNGHGVPGNSGAGPGQAPLPGEDPGHWEENSHNPTGPGSGEIDPHDPAKAQGDRIQASTGREGGHPP